MALYFECRININALLRTVVFDDFAHWEAALFQRKGILLSCSFLLSYKIKLDHTLLHRLLFRRFCPLE